MSHWDEALQAFRIPALALAELRGGWTNATVRVKTAGATFVLRRHQGLVRAASPFERKFGVVTDIAQHCALVAAPLQTSTGSYTFHSSGGAMYSASPYIAGTTASSPHATPAALASALAAFHRASGSVAEANAPVLRSYDTMQWLSRQFERFGNAPDVRRSLDWKLLRALAEQCGRTLRAVPAAQLPVLWVHGDFCAENIVVSRGRTAGIIDFDFVHRTERMYDIATLVDSLAAHSREPFADAGIAREVLDAYDAVLPLSAAERACVDLFRMRRNLAMVWYITTRHGTLRGTALQNARRAAALSHHLARRTVA